MNEASSQTACKRTRPLAAFGVASLALGLLCTGITGQVPRAEADTDVRRFALVVGNDLGGGSTPPLLYARDDARRVRDVLVRLGGVKSEDALLVLGRGAGAVTDALATLEERIRGAEARGQSSTLVFYYSGHAKDGHLLLGRTRLALDTIKRRIGSSPAALRIAIIDSCRSGAVSRIKGTRKGPAFEVETTGAEVARGTVFLTSSSFDEDSQESDHIGGSYFSHHLINGLQGQADRSDDGRVTLAEAYAYTYARTVADTADSAAGAQHPTFSYDLKGNGDFILSMYAESREGMLLPGTAPAGTYFLVDGEGIVAAEVSKADGQERRIAVRSGRYTVKRRMADRLRVGHVSVPRGQVVTLNEGTLRDVPFSDDPVKGVYRDVRSHYSLSVGAGGQTFFRAPEGEALFPKTGMLATELVIGDFFRRNWDLGLDLSAGGGEGVVTRDTVTAPFRMGQVTLGTSLLFDWPFLDGDVVPFAGVRVAFLALTRQFPDTGLPDQRLSTFTPGAIFGLRYRIGERWQLIARARLHYLLYTVDETRSLGFYELALALGYDF